ncbi:MAG: hypothetical protein VR64_15380 [Desulfatitalea sp. BRH_c12]|nr:MAG: hypothetical protein VR64_15380 [Desulfatitalea sp. BRH_c12]
MRTDIIYWLFLPMGTMVATLLCWMVYGACQRVIRNRPAKSQLIVPDNITGPSPATRRQSEQAEMAVRNAAGYIVATPLVFGGSYAFLYYLYPEMREIEPALAFVCGGTFMGGYAYFSYRRARRQKREILWYHEARKVVDRAIAPFVARGYIVFRDFVTEGFQIDHLLLGPKGVFALQAFVRQTDADAQRTQNATVTYDGRALFFPDGREHVIIDQTEECAERFSQWITQRVGILVAARGVVALPGWRVKRISPEGLSVINPSQMEALFQYVTPRPLSEEMLQKIVYHIESHYDAGMDVSREIVTGEGLVT